MYKKLLGKGPHFWLIGFVLYAIGLYLMNGAQYRGTGVCITIVGSFLLLAGIFKKDELNDISDSFANVILNYPDGGVEETETQYIQCSCGTDILQINCQTTYALDPILKIEQKMAGSVNKTVHHQEFYISMFTYGQFPRKRKFLSRLAVAYHYIKTGTYFSDQIILSDSEADKLASFLIGKKRNPGTVINQIIS